MYGAVGSSVTFTWSFTGVYRITWGLKKAGLNDITALVSLDETGMSPVTPPVPSEYIGRVNGTIIGSTSSGKAIFTLTNLNKGDERSYGCNLTPSDFSGTKFDLAQLVVQGEYFLNIMVIAIADKKIVMTTFNKSSQFYMKLTFQINFATAMRVQ